jgi:hypothetical protein
MPASGSATAPPQEYWAIDRIAQDKQTWIAAKSMIYYQVDIIDRSVAIF